MTHVWAIVEYYLYSILGTDVSDVWINPSVPVIPLGPAPPYTGPFPTFRRPG